MSDTKNKKPWEKILKSLGKYYIIRLDEQKQKEFNGLPTSDDEKDVQIILPESVMKKNSEDKAVGYEYVFRVEFVGDECDMVVNENGGLTKVPPICKVGDVVLAKGTVSKILSDPPMWACVRDNIVAVLEEAPEE